MTKRPAKNAPPSDERRTPANLANHKQTAAPPDVPPRPRSPHRGLLITSAVGLAIWIAFLLLVALRWA